MPARPGIGADGPAAGYRVSVHLPDRGLAARVLKKDVGRPSPLKSPFRWHAKLVPGLALTDPPPIKVFPFISQIETWPRARVLEKDVGKTIPIKIASTDHLPNRARIGVDAPPPIKVFPFISQIETWPVLVFCQRMSALPSALKSPVPTAFHSSPGLGLTGPPPTKVVAAHFPNRDLAGVRILPQDVGVAIVIEIPGSDGSPGKPRDWGSRGRRQLKCCRSFPRSTA